MPWGIGDAIVVGLSAVDQIRCNDPAGDVEIDVLCNQVQSEIFAEDARIHRVIEVDRELFPIGATGIWKRGIFLSAEQVKLAQFLRAQSYAAVLPFLFAPAFFYCLHRPVMFFNPWEAWRIMARLRALEDTPMQILIRGIVNKYFGRKMPDFTGEATIPLYICPEHVLKARRTVAWIRARAGMPQGRGKLLMVAPDTSSVITRPPTPLLAEGIADALRRDHSLLVAILPGYTDVDAAPRLEQALLPTFPERVFLLPAEPPSPLLELAALIDQCDIFVSGDTGVMHLAAATKRLASAGGGECEPRNTVKIISLFGGTNPALHGYSRRSVILGRGRKEQTRIAPGVMKDMYDPAGKNLFDHIAPQQLTEAICSSLQDGEVRFLASS
jgi:ADP-heptose:LPS heptosyltransferase